MKEHAVKLAILDMLSDGHFHSGEELGDQLEISRAAVSKHIKGIQAWGVDIFSVQGKGYKLADSMQLLNQQQLQNSVDVPVELIPVIGSTNQYLMDRIGLLQSGSVCIAEYQSQGRGRRGREWVSPFGCNLYLSMYWRLEAGMAGAMGLSLVVGVAIVEALEKIGIEGIKLKWPNDLYFYDKKLAGILVEMSGQAGAAAHLVIGMGMNLKMAASTQGITQPWSCLSDVTESAIDRNQLATTLINTLQTALSEYEIHGMQGFVERWNRLDNYLGREVRLIMGAREVSGISCGINEQGAVLIRTNSGLETYIGGEISLRGM
ncbi:bifunctional biotin--[acetyl-CoA-carboxylase] ligase/biotin operon repressor BirA [Vibrio scophthalmi]|uniref:Bifunctional ligase/repressor BirA n=1 Tax=Vibrio scophthalmi LMG 19158 TaxID=870967 RepID=F9RKG2_9VIBR|nr:bifunctional biotin--[acetyl-CoA-carboxylase] ligase/biotin operon repressor BirA [Vibrio scophthalmi]EGU39791.1 biotin--protein ligase [Vibrio scophthalmi LMG 19158]